MNHREYYKSIEGAISIKVGKTAGEVVNYTSSNEKFVSVAFKGRSKKSSYAYSFDNEIAREKFQSEWINKQIEADKEKQVRRDELKKIDLRDAIKVDDIYYNSWGYEQTNIDFYKVVRVTAKTIYCVSIASEYDEEHNSMSGTVKPTDRVLDAEETAFRCLGLSSDEEGFQFSVKHGCLGRYTGKSLHCSSYH